MIRWGPRFALRLCCSGQAQARGRSGGAEAVAAGVSATASQRGDSGCAHPPRSQTRFPLPVSGALRAARRLPKNSCLSLSWEPQFGEMCRPGAWGARLQRACPDPVASPAPNK